MNSIVSSLTGQKIAPNNCKNDFEFYLKHYCWYQNEKGDVYTWGSGEMGQLGYNGKVISMMPKDREGYPFQVTYNTILKHRMIFNLKFSHFHQKQNN